jgi:hypothetical protein
MRQSEIMVRIVLAALQHNAGAREKLWRWTGGAVRQFTADSSGSDGSNRCGSEWQHEESSMISELQIHVIARQMFERHGFEAIAQAAQNAIACESRGETEEAREWRHLEDAMKMMRGPHQS